MKKPIISLLLLFSAQIIFSGCTKYEPNRSEHPVESKKSCLPEGTHEPITELLIDMVEHTPELKTVNGSHWVACHQ